MARTYLSDAMRKSGKCCGLSAMLALSILLLAPMFVDLISLYFIGGILFLVPLLTAVITPWMPKERVSSHGKAVFITGCDTGFGHMLARRLDEIGFQVFAGCLFADGDGAKELQRCGSDRLHVISVDVSNDASVEKAAQHVEENLGNNVLWAIVNNAGIAVMSEVAWTTMDTFKKIFDVNALGVVRVTKAFLLKLKESKGRILTVASQGGHITFPTIVDYCMTKAAAISFSDGLRLELYKWGIQVISIEPGCYRTPIMDKEENYRRARNEWERAPKNVKALYSHDYMDSFVKRNILRAHTLARDPIEVVSAMEDAITDMQPEYTYWPGSPPFWLVSWTMKFLPRPVIDWITFFIIYGEKPM